MVHPTAQLIRLDRKRRANWCLCHVKQGCDCTDIVTKPHIAAGLRLRGSGAAHHPPCHVLPSSQHALPSIPQTYSSHQTAQGPRLCSVLTHVAVSLRHIWHGEDRDSSG